MQLSVILRKIIRRLQLIWLPDSEDLNANIKRYLHSTGKVPVQNRPNDFTSQIEILIPCFNHADYLATAVQSIATQTWHQAPITVTFIDDNSSDNTAQVIEKLIQKFQSKHLTFQVIRNAKNLRQDGSLNKAIQVSKNQLFVIVNDDDALTPDAIGLIVSTFKEHMELYMLGGSIIWFEGKLPKYIKKPIQPKLTLYSPIDALNFHALNDINMTQTSCAFFRQAWQAAGGYKPKSKRLTPDMNEDRDFQMRVATLVPVGVYENHPTAFWRTDSSHGKGY